MTRARGFTLIELVVALTILGVMMLLLYSGLSFALRSWDAGDAVGRVAADRRIGEAFVRRELNELFPMRWKDSTRVRLAFEGKRDSLRFISTRPAGVTLGGLAMVGLSAEGDSRRGQRNLVMRRAPPDDNADSFDGLDAVDPVVLLATVDKVEFAYFGAENDFTDPKWQDEWTYVQRIPQLVRLRVTLGDGSVLPDLVVRLMVGEEAACLETGFQRICRPRRSI